MKTEDSVEIAVLEANPQLAIPIIAERLRSGSLALAIGAGASAGFGLPTWYQLVHRCLLKAGIDTVVDKDTPNETLRSLAEQIEQKLGPHYHMVVSDALYEGVEYSDNMLKQDLLISLGALLMGSRRGNVNEIINFNFDNVLEWYLHLHGYTTQTVSHIPSLLRDVDVTIYHPHGYLPKDLSVAEFSRFLVFSQYSYDERFAAFDTDPWVAHFVHTLRSKELLFVGLSGDDPMFGPLLVKVYPEIRHSRYTGFWFFGPDVKTENIDKLKSRGVVPLRFGSHLEIAQYLLKVCQEAAING
jgi:hypothetical protein